MIADYGRLHFVLNPSAAIDHAGTIVWRSIDPAFVVNHPLDAGVDVVFDGPDLAFDILQAEGTTSYYRSSQYDRFTALESDGSKKISDLIISDIVPFATLTLTPTIPAPSISEATQNFTGTLNVNTTPPSGMKVLYTLNGQDVLPNSAEWPGGIGAYTALAITQSCILQWRGYDADGVPTQQGIAIFTLVTSGGGGGPGTPTCGSVSVNIVSGTPSRTAITVSLLCATAGSSIHYRKNGGSWVTFTGTPISLLLDTDWIEFYSSATGYNDSPTDYFDNP